MTLMYVLDKIIRLLIFFDDIYIIEIKALYHKS